MSTNMDDDDYLVISLLLQLFALYGILAQRGIQNQQCGKAVRPRRWWVRPRLQDRDSNGAFITLVLLLRNKDPEEYKNYFRLTPNQFDFILEKVKPHIRKKLTNFRKPIAPEIRLAVTLRYLACGTSQRDLSFVYKIGRSTLSRIIREVTETIWKVLKNEYVKPPTTTNEWQDIEHEFASKWNFPNCIGAIDGKHIQIRCPNKSGSQYYNYKNMFSFVLMAVCDADYKFTFIDIGNYGRISDGGVFANSWFGKQILKSRLNLPQPRRLTPDTPVLPHVFVGDEAFPLKTNIMRPFPGKCLTLNKKIFNYRLSRARRTIENTFGIMVARWRILHRPIDTTVETGVSIVKAIICLHNFLRANQTTQNNYCPPNFVDAEDGQGNVIPGQWRVVVRDANTNMLVLQRTRMARCSDNEKTTREHFMSYFSSAVGALNWQEEHVTRC